MATNYLQDGNTLNWSNTTGKDVKSGDPVSISKIVGIAHADIAAGADGVLHMAGVFVLPKAAEEIVQGQRLYLVGGKLSAAGENIVGTAWTNAGRADSHVAARILGF